LLIDLYQATCANDHRNSLKSRALWPLTCYTAETTLATTHLQTTHRKPSRGKAILVKETNVDALIETIHAKGLYINNLFEFAHGWRANVTDRHAYFEFGEGRTAAEALRAALKKATVSRR
jgi:hypothetical protein